MALPYPTPPGDIDHLIADDHAVVERLFQHLEAGRGDRRKLADQVGFQLSLHADAEERVLYPAMAGAGEAEESATARKEHRTVKELVAVLEHGEPGQERFEEALTRLIADVRQHVAEEEGRFLPAFRAAVGAERMGELGEEFLAAKRSAPTRAHPVAPSSGTGHRLVDAAAAVVDKARDEAGRGKGLATDASGLLDTQAQRLLDALSALGPRPLETLGPQEARRQPSLVDAVERILREDGQPAAPEPVDSVEDIVLPGPGGDLPVRVHTPAESSSQGPLPVLMWIHGGGWVLHTVDTYDASCRGLANKTGAVVVSPEYRRAPEHVFPAAHDDVLAAWRWVRENAASLGGDASRMAIGGESVGGTMAASTCVRLKRAGEEQPVFQVLVYPLTTGEQIGGSMEDAADARPLNRPLLSWMALHAFRGVPEGAKDPRVDLLSLSPGELSGLPPALVVTVERDVLRDQGEEFAERLRTAGVETVTSRYDGVMHEFFGAAAVLDAADRAQREVAAHLQRAFGAAAAPG